MFKAMNKYYEISIDKLIELKEMISKENIELTCVNPKGMSIIVPGNCIDIILQEKDNVLLKDSKYYISSFSNKFFNLNNPQTNKNNVVEGSDDNKFNEYEYFYHIYKNCISKNEKLKAANDSLLSRMLKERPNNRLYLLKPYLDQLKLEAKTPKVTPEIASNIERLLTGMGIVGRLDFIRHLKYIKSAGKNRNDTVNTETEIMISSIMNGIVTYLEKEYFYRDIFDNLDMLDDSNILSHSNRVCILMIEFLYYYNNIFNKGLSSKLRQDYKSVYFEKYKTILSRFNLVKSIEKLENVYRLGIRKFTGSEIVSYAIGSFYHDVAMLNMIDFVPTDDFIKDGDFKDFHTAKAYYFLKYVLNQREESCLSVGLHHECYGYGSGILKNFFDKKINDPKHKADFLMSFEPEDIINAECFAYFPAKMLEVVDIYDTLTFMDGKRNKNPYEVVFFMKKMFTENKIAVDPIVLDLFIQFLSNVKGVDIIEE